MAPKKQKIRKSALTPTALVSGGAGFVGSHLVESFLSNNARVVVLDNYRTGKDIHIKHLLNNPNFAFYNVDINAGIPDEIESVDYVIHLAGLEEYLYSKDFINLDSLLTNSSGTKNLLDLARVSNAKFLLVSTTDVYQGRMSQVDIVKYFGDTGFEENKFSLTEAKRFAEAVVWEYFKKHDIDARIVRLPEVYGPRMSLEASGFLGGFLKNITEGTDLSIYGDGFEKECYLYVSDVVSGLIKSLFSPNTKGNIYSLIPDSPISALELAYLVRKMADAEVNVLFKPKIGDVPQQLRMPDAFNLKDIGWKSKVDLSQGIAKTLDWFGYKVNENTFKPAKFIQQKKDGISEQPLFTIASEQKDYPIPPVYTPLPKNKFSKLSFPKLSLPKIHLQLPKFGSVENIFAGKPAMLLKISAVVFSAICIFIALPVGSFLFSVKNGINSMQKVQKAFGSLDSNTVILESAKANASFKTARKSFTAIKWTFSIVGKKDAGNSYGKLLSSLGYFSEATGDIGSAIKPAEKLFDILRPDTQSTFDQNYIDQVQLEISKAQRSLSLAEAEIKIVDSKYLPKKYSGQYNLYQNFLADTQKSLTLVSNLASEIPEILGSTEEKNYIVWFQNSNEIRPTGGFIGSYGLLKVSGGKLREVVIDDIYNPDGQIKLRNILSSPPQPIIDYLSENNLYLRNSNWDPDFTKSVKTFDDLYFKVTGSKIDGYMAVDLSFVKNVLKVTGPVFLAAYNEEITPDNLYERAQFHSDFNYQDGSDQKRSFLTVLGSKLLEKMFALPKDKFTNLVGEISNSLEQKHFLIYFMNNPFNAFLKEKSWDGGLVQTQGDYLYIVNSNLGGTKANYFVKNKMTYEILSMTRDGLLRANLYLDYSHTGKDLAWPGGPYKDYVRVLTQNGSKLTGARFIRDGEEEDIFNNVVITKEGLYNSFEFGFTLEPTKSIKVILSYDLPQNLSATKENKDYDLLWQKQPGTEGDQYSFIFNPPFGMQIKSYGDNLKLIDSTLTSEGVITTDSNYFVKLQ